MRLESSLPISMMAFRQWDEADREVQVILAKAEFKRREDGRFIADPEKPEIRVSDEFAPGEPGFAELKFEQDLFPSKPATDLLIRGLARTVNGRKQPQWTVRVEIPEKLSHEFVVRGPSEWRAGLTGWKMTDPKPVAEVPLRYGLAYGGVGPSKDDPEKLEACEGNPSGQGFASSGMLKKGDPFPAPQIGLLADFNGAQVDKPMMVCGTAPIAKSWFPRRAEAGTFDEIWKETRHPMMPKDYSLRFWNCAPVPLQISPYLVGDETVHLTGLSPVEKVLEMRLPGVGLDVRLFKETAVKGAEPPEQTELKTVRLDVSTVELDVQAKDPADHRISIVWAAVVVEPFDLGKIKAVRLTPRAETQEEPA